MRCVQKMPGILLAAVSIFLLWITATAGRTLTTVKTTGTTIQPTTVLRSEHGSEVQGAAPGRKYAKYVTPAPIEPGPTHGPFLDLRGRKYGNTAVTFRYRLVTASMDMVTEPHQHKFTEFLMFYGSDAKNIKDFGGEIEFSIGKGKDAETYVITSPTVLYLPAGVPHGPLRFKKIDKTVAMVVLALTPDYATSDSKQ